jgi:hypothetical protein
MWYDIQDKRTNAFVDTFWTSDDPNVEFELWLDGEPQDNFVFTPAKTTPTTEDSQVFYREAINLLLDA